MPYQNPPKKKSAERLLAERIAREYTIQVKSAYRRIQRAAQKQKQPQGIRSKYDKQLYSKYVKIERPQNVRLAKPKSYFEQFEEGLQELGRKIKAGEYKGKFLGIEDLPRGDLVDRIAVLANVIGIDDVADELETNQDIIDNLLQGGRLNYLSAREIESGYENLNPDEIDLDYVEREAAVLQDTLKAIDISLANIFRQAVINGDVNLDEIWERGHSLLGSVLTQGRQLDKILESYQEYIETGSYPCWNAEQQKFLRKTDKIDLNEMFAAYEADEHEIWDIEDSEFWAWFRELFYC